VPFINRCPDCPYAGKAVGPRGSVASRLVLVGEAPGETEIAEGRPFVGPAGGVLRDALAEAGIDEASVFITNSVACRPLNPAKPIRTPATAAIEACRGRLVRDIEAHPRAVIVALGATAVEALTGQRGFPVTKKPVADLRSDWAPIVPTVHPAFVRRRGLEGPEYQMLAADLRHARHVADGGASEEVEMKMPNVPNFRLRFKLSEVMYWTARYAYADDAEVEAIGSRARERGWYTRDEFLTVARWKSPRSRRRCEENDESHVKAATLLALSTPDERQRIEALTQLHGIDYPTASVLLHLAHQDPYPIIDFRALWSLGVETPPSAYSFTYWWAYTQACRSLATDAGVRMRTLDRALWQFSKERRPSKGGTAADSADAFEAPPPGEASESKSATMRRLFAQGRTVVEVAKALRVDYSFAFGVRKGWLAAQTEPSGQRDDSHDVPGRVGAAVHTRVLGVDAAAGEWLAILLVDGYFAGADLQPTVSGLLARFPGVEVVGVDIPIGLPHGRLRPADAAARAFVGPERAPSVFSTLPADVLNAPTYSEAAEIAVRLLGKSLSRQSFALASRISKVADLAAQDSRIREVHPEVSFREMNGTPLRYSKHSWSGIAERRALLASVGILLPDNLPGSDRAAPDDVVDAAAAAWSAMRVAEGRSATLPAEPSGDPANGGVIHF
jgi:uracil-DNA glycosylase family 4